MAKYVLTTGMNGKPVGSEIELTEEQAQHPLYRMRVAKVEEPAKVELVVATPKVEVGVDGVDAEELTAAVKREVKRGRKAKEA